MNLADIPLFSMLKGRLGYLSERQKVIAQNVANSDTPRYRAEDLKPFSFNARLQAQQQASAAGTMSATQAGHMTPKSDRRAGGGTFKTVKTGSSETTLNGNAVVLEEEMLKLSDARMSYDAAISFYQKSMGLLRMASRPPGRG
ncbi:flagellar basal body rod protein FlgB [Phenylobacterium sp.]|uniref:flagellar basal body rod protein FlgB n=1 Tax=Phenylobacterium sp. TaxID=1871053 RepID=UPI00301E3D0B